MSFTVHSFKMIEECNVCSHFLKWQRKGGDIVIDEKLSDVQIQGLSSPFIMDQDGKIIAQGIVQLVDAFRKTGIILYKE